MALSRNEVNPLGILGVRKLNFIPKHFAKLSVSMASDVTSLDQWISYNLNSRYAIKRTVVLDQNNKIVEMLQIGMEDPRDLTMLSLGCPHIHKK